nr:hypothetical protein [Nanoarchaeum sp.]
MPTLREEKETLMFLCGYNSCDQDRSNTYYHTLNYGPSQPLIEKLKFVRQNHDANGIVRSPKGKTERITHFNYSEVFNIDEGILGIGTITSIPLDVYLELGSPLVIRVKKITERIITTPNLEEKVEHPQLK